MNVSLSHRDVKDAVQLLDMEKSSLLGIQYSANTVSVDNYTLGSG